jgi:4-amino-4-deoxy-L-arabinose transferase-like glycosyltransferase
MNKLIKTPWFLLIVILVIAGFLRFYQITKLPPGFYPDEAMYANNGVEAWETGNFKVFYPENNGREGLWSNIIGFFIVKFGHEPWVPRTVAAVFGILTVLGLYFLAKELFSTRIAFLSSFLLATSFWHINFSRIGFRAILAPFFLVWAIYFLLKSLNSILRTSDIHRMSDVQKLKPFKNKVQLIVLCLIGGIFYGLGFYTYIAYRLTPILIFIILVFYWLRLKQKTSAQSTDLTQFWTAVSIFLIISFIVALPLGIYFLNNPQDFFGRTSEISIFSSPTPLKDLGINIIKTAGMFNFAGDQNWRHNYAGQPALFWPVGILFLLGIFLGIKSIIKRSQKLEFDILFSWFVVAALPVVISNEGLPHALRALLMVPAVFILAGIGGVYLYEFIKSRILTTSDVVILNIFVFIFLSLLVFEAYVAYFILWGQNSNVLGAFNENYVIIGRQLNALPKELPKYVVVKATGVEVRGIPMPAQTIMFITDTFTLEKQTEKNIFYLLPEQQNQIPPGSYVMNLE